MDNVWWILQTQQVEDGGASSDLGTTVDAASTTLFLRPAMTTVCAA